MAELWSRPSIGHVGSYQASGMPWLTGGVVPDASLGDQEIQLVFPLVTKRIQIFSLTSSEIRVHFVSLSEASAQVYSGSHYVTIPSGSLRDLSVKSKTMFVSAPSGSLGGGFEVVAELTHIPITEMYKLTGSGHTD